jgi:large conductance mechanosensitive channel
LSTGLSEFSGLVHQFVQSFINPLLALAGGKPSFNNLVVKVGRATFTYGAFLTEVISFIIAALVVYYILVMPTARLLRMLERNRAATQKDCPECTMSIPIEARRCPQCTADLRSPEAAPQPATSAR